MAMTPEENEVSIQGILQTCPGMTREKIAEWDKVGKPMTKETLQQHRDAGVKRPVRPSLQDGWANQH